MNNEPVAWMSSVGGEFVYVGYEPAEGYLAIPLYTHPAKELHLSLQKNKETGELLAVTYTDDEHRIVEVLWQKPPAKTLTAEEINQVAKECKWDYDEMNVVDFARAILRKAQEK